MNKYENLRKRLLYRSSYRGKKEMDILLSSFVKYYINKFSKDDLDELEKLLDHEDEVILDFYQNNISNKFFKESKISKLLKDFKI
jgi:antitoxin CptB|tara:strand:+ start:2992 stop:3246 length:255 start_codon:yes stop_codon:yes gene_type:complete